MSVSVSASMRTSLRMRLRVKAPSFSSTNVPSSVLDDARHVSIFNSFFSFSLFAIFIVTLLHDLQANSARIQSLQAPLHLFLSCLQLCLFLALLSSEQSCLSLLAFSTSLLCHHGSKARPQLKAAREELRFEH